MTQLLLSWHKYTYYISEYFEHSETVFSILLERFLISFLETTTIKMSIYASICKVELPSERSQKKMIVFISNPRFGLLDRLSIRKIHFHGLLDLTITEIKSIFRTTCISIFYFSTDL